MRARRRGDGFIFPSIKDPSRSISHHLATRWLRHAERLAGLEPLKGGAWHPFRRAWASQRKHLSVKDVAYAGGWTDTSTLLRCYQAPDAETDRGGDPGRAAFAHGPMNWRPTCTRCGNTHLVTEAMLDDMSPDVGRAILDRELTVSEAIESVFPRCASCILSEVQDDGLGP